MQFMQFKHKTAPRRASGLRAGEFLAVANDFAHPIDAQMVTIIASSPNFSQMPKTHP
jgi:hypothetical protein